MSPLRHLRRVGRPSAALEADELLARAKANDQDALTAIFRLDVERSAERLWLTKQRQASRAVRTRAVAMGFAAVVLLGAGIGWWLRTPDALSARLEGRTLEVGRWVEAREQAAIVFSDGTSVRVAPGGRARIEALDAYGARVMMERGTLSASVLHRGDTAWLFRFGDGITSCGPPTTLFDCAPGVVGDTWITRAPSTPAETDCNDLRDDVNPSITAFSATPIAGAPAGVDFDFTCDGVEEIERSAIGICATLPEGCRFEEGWSVSPDSAPPGCGATGNWLESCGSASGTARCVPVVSSSVQRYR